MGPGESSDEQEVLFRFRSVRKMSALCFGVVGVGRRTPPSTDPPDNGKGRKRVRSTFYPAWLSIVPIFFMCCLCWSYARVSESVCWSGPAGGILQGE